MSKSDIIVFDYNTNNIIFLNLIYLVKHYDRKASISTICRFTSG